MARAFVIELVSVLCYNIHMEKKYKKAKNTVAMVIYHFVFCPRYRRKIFLIDGVEVLFKEILPQICEQHGIDLLQVECDTDHCHLLLNCPPELSPADIMKIIKRNTGKVLLAEIPQLAAIPTLWTRNYFVSTEKDVGENSIMAYVDIQRKR